MKAELFVAESELPVSAGEAFAWHERNGAFLRLAPPWERIELVSAEGGIRDGGRTEIRMRMGPFSQRWLAEHRNYVAGEQFEDVQKVGPFAVWEHVHRIHPLGPDRCRLEDRIRFAPPGGAVGRWAGKGWVRRILERTFRYRHRVTRDDLVAHHQASEAAPMNVLISGASGLVGSSLTPMLQTGGHTVVRLARSRRDTPEREVIWNPESESLDPRQLEGIDAVVHLAGEGIADRRWNTAQKERIRSSRQVGTRKLAEAVARMEKPPKVFVCASAIGYYGDRGDEILDESSLPGSGFLPDVCVGWEDACQPVREKGIRTVNVRIGVVLSPQGGALKKMLLPFQLGAGGVIGSGQQYWSWIALDDVVGLLHHALTNDRVSGPMNATSPHPCTNREFTKTLGRVLRRPTIFPVPAFMAKLALGEMANDLLLASARVMPHAAQSTGYPFRFPELEPALRHLLGR